MAKELPSGNSLPTSIPKNDPQIIRVPFEENEMGARKSHIPKLSKNFGKIKHVGNEG